MRFKEFNTVYTQLVRVARRTYYDDKFKEYIKDGKQNLAIKKCFRKGAEINKYL